MSTFYGAETKVVPIVFSNKTGGAAAGTSGSYDAAKELDSTNDYTCWNFIVPWDFHTLVEAVLYVYIDTTKADCNIDLATEYGGDGEAIGGGSESDTTSTYALTQAKWNFMDISSVLSAIAAGDFVYGQIKLGENITVNVPYYVSGHVRYR